MSINRSNNITVTFKIKDNQIVQEEIDNETDKPMEDHAHTKWIHRPHSGLVLKNATGESIQCTLRPEHKKDYLFSNPQVPLMVDKNDDYTFKGNEHYGPNVTFDFLVVGQETGMTNSGGPDGDDIEADDS